MWTKDILLCKVGLLLNVFIYINIIYRFPWYCSFMEISLCLSMISVSNCQFTALISYFSYRKDSLKWYPLLYNNHHEARNQNSYLECYRYLQEEHEHHIVFTHDVGINESLHNFFLSLWSIVFTYNNTYTGRSDLRPKSDR